MNEDLNDDAPAKLAKKSFNTIVTGTLSAINPGLGIAYGLAVAFFATALELRSSKVEEWVSMIKVNYPKFKQEIVNSYEFQDAFVSSLEDYIRLRSLLKRAVAQKIFLGYAASSDLSLFQLERHNETVKNISSQSLKFLRFLSETIEPIRLARVQKDADTYDLDSTDIEETQIRESVNRQQIMSYAYDDWTSGEKKHIQVMVPSKKNPKYPTISGSSAVYLEDKELSSHNEALIELEALGIIWRRQYSETQMQFGARPVWFDRWDLTSFGREFIGYLEGIEAESQGEE